MCVGVRKGWRWGVMCVMVPAHSSSGGQYESRPDIKRYLVSALGNINHTLFSSFSLMPPHLSPVVSCELLPGRPGQGRWQPVKARQARVMPVHLVTVTAAAWAAFGRVGVGREQRNRSGRLSVSCFQQKHNSAPCHTWITSVGANK